MLCKKLQYQYGHRSYQPLSSFLQSEKTFLQIVGSPETFFDQQGLQFSLELQQITKKYPSYAHCKARTIKEVTAVHRSQVYFCSHSRLESPH